MTPIVTSIEKFWRTTTPGRGGCLLWTGLKAGRGYGSFHPVGHGKKPRPYAHRWIYERIVGSIPAGVVIMHSCDTPACVALQHLSAGSTSLNHLDAFAKGRKSRVGSVQVGDRFGRWVVTAQESPSPRGGTRWLCRCDCGTERRVTGRLLRIGKSTSCGCFMRENNRRLISERNRKRAA